MKRPVLSLLVSILAVATLHAQLPPSTYSNPKVERSKLYKKGNEYQRDVLLFFDMLGSTHPAFAPNSPVAPPFDIDRACREGYAWAAGCDSKEALSARLQSVFSTIPADGHSVVARDYNNTLVYPLMYFETDGRFYLQNTDRKYESSLGKEILKINGTPIKEVVDSFRSAFSSENEVQYAKQIRKQFSFEFLWEQNPHRRPDNALLLTFSDGTEITIEATDRTKLDLVSVLQQTGKPEYLIRQNTGMPFSYRIAEDKGICYLQFASCMDQSSARVMLMNNSHGLTPEQIEERLAKIPRFDTFLTEMFGEIAAKNIRTLVVDVRDNGGGNSMLCNMLLSWLKPMEEMKKGNAEIRFSTLWEQSYPDLSEKYRTAFANKGEKYRPGRLYDSRWMSEHVFNNESDKDIMGYGDLFEHNTDPAKIFGGNTVFIQNENTYSSAGDLIVDALDNGIGRLIGSSDSSFRACNYGDILTWQLPNTGITGFISHKFFTRPDASKCGEETITPEVKINYTWADVVSGEDLCWKWIVENNAK